jgi:hypothetical protein
MRIYNDDLPRAYLIRRRRLSLRCENLSYRLISSQRPLVRRWKKFSIGVPLTGGINGVAPTEPSAELPPANPKRANPPNAALPDSRLDGTPLYL